jgi:hypothetical protein
MTTWVISVLKSMTRVRRSALAVRRGPEILELLVSPNIRRALREAAERGEPPVTAVSERLKIDFAKDMKLTPVRQFVGLVVRAILEEEGFRVAASGVRISRDPVFRTGAVYEPASNERELGPLENLAEFLVQKLSESEIGRLRQLLRHGNR